MWENFIFDIRKVYDSLTWENEIFKGKKIFDMNRFEGRWYLVGRNLTEDEI